MTYEPAPLLPDPTTPQPGTHWTNPVTDYTPRADGVASWATAQPARRAARGGRATC